jgi:hypothetical protein
MRNRLTWLSAVAGACLVYTGLSLAAETPQHVMCATVEALDCEPGNACLRGRPAELGAPAFIRIDFENKVVAGPHRTTPIVAMEKTADGVLLQGTEAGYGWTLVLDTKQGTMAATLVNREGAFVLFGSCTPL